VNGRGPGEGEGKDGWMEDTEDKFNETTPGRAGPPRSPGSFGGGGDPSGMVAFGPPSALASSPPCSPSFLVPI
jgi:hypothetical protein